MCVSVSEFSYDDKRYRLFSHTCYTSSLIPLHLFTLTICARYKLGTLCIYIRGTRGGVVVKALRYKPAGRGFDSRWCHWNFSVT